MNTLVQDTSIPIYIFLKYEKNVLKFPINPESLSLDTPSDSETEEVLGVGEVSVPGETGLATLSIESFFWKRENLLPSELYVMWLKKWQKSKKPATLIVTRLNYSMQVTCEKFNHTINAGEEEDIYFKLDLKEYRPHEARFLRQEKNTGLLDQLQSMLDAATPPVLIEIPRPVRGQTLKEQVKNTFTAVSGYDTLCSITKKATGATDGWNALYSANKEALGDILAGDGNIPIGTVLAIPAEWTKRGLSAIMEV